MVNTKKAENSLAQATNTHSSHLQELVPSYLCRIPFDHLTLVNRQTNRQTENMYLVSIELAVIETLVKVWENSKKLWKHSPATRVPTAFLVLPNFLSCFYNSLNIK